VRSPSSPHPLTLPKNVLLQRTRFNDCCVAELTNRIRKLQSGSLGLSFACNVHRRKLRNVPFRQPDRRDWGAIRFRQLSSDADAEWTESNQNKHAMRSGTPSILPVPSSHPHPEAITYSASVDIHGRDQRKRLSAPPYSARLYSFISHGRLSDAYHSTLTLFHPHTEPLSRQIVTKLIDLSTFPKWTDDEYTYAAGEARKAMVNEWEMYTKCLRPLQGTVIPTRYGSWVSDGEGGELEVMVLCMEDAGAMLAEDMSELDDEDK